MCLFHIKKALRGNKILLTIHYSTFHLVTSKYFGKYGVLLVVFILIFCFKYFDELKCAYSWMCITVPSRHGYSRQRILDATENMPAC